MWCEIDVDNDTNIGSWDVVSAQFAIVNYVNAEFGLRYAYVLIFEITKLHATHAAADNFDHAATVTNKNGSVQHC